METQNAEARSSADNNGGGKRPMDINWRVSFLTVLFLIIAARASQAQGSAEPTAAMQNWVTATARQEGAVAPRTRVTMSNWQQYQQYMPLGMVELFRGTHYWKMPADVQIDVGPTVSYPLPRSYVDFTEKHSSQVRVTHLADGNNDIVNYMGGEPFPNPAEPDKGYKLLADLWFTYAPYLSVGGADNPLHSCTQDRFGSIFCQVVEYVYRQVAYNTDPRVPSEDPRAGGLWFTEWLMWTRPSNPGTRHN